MLDMLGTLSLDDMFMSFGGAGVMPNDTKHLATDLTDWSCEDPHVCVFYNFHWWPRHSGPRKLRILAAAACHPLVHFPTK